MSGFFNGINWKTIAMGATQLVCPENTNENTYVTIPIKGGTPGAYGALRIFILGGCTNSANNKTTRARLGGVSGSEVLSCVVTTAQSFSTVRDVFNRGAQNSQVVYDPTTTTTYGTRANAVSTFAVDLSQDFDLVITGQKASAGETLTLEAYRVEALLL